jgi:Na+-transporting NADH:ubiquinone oxidoreductase subunit C
MFKNGQFLPVSVVKAGQHPSGDEDYVDGVSGGTITSKGVSAMLHDCLTPYEAFLQTIRNKQ